MGKKRAGNIEKTIKTEKTVDLGLKDSYSLKRPPNSGIRAGKLQGIGQRSSQQDCFGVSDVSEKAIAAHGLLAVMADGMGGMADGEKASMEAVVACLGYFDAFGGTEHVSKMLLVMAQQANERVKRRLAEKGSAGGATLLAAMVQNRQCHWLSVGDSHIYLYREDRLGQLNHEHNYAAQLAADGRLTQEEAQLEPDGRALTSYIGIEELTLVDRNESPLLLKPKDRILLATDGVFHTLSGGEIADSMKYPVEESMICLGMQIEKKRRENQDNYTAVLIEIE